MPMKFCVFACARAQQNPYTSLLYITSLKLYENGATVLCMAARAAYAFIRSGSALEASENK